MMRGRLADIGILVPPFFNLDGKIKEKPEDFVVEEIFKGKKLSIKYNIIEKIKDSLFFLRKKRRYFHFTLVKRNISTLDFLEILRRRGVKKVWYCGIKDKLAVTSQRICILSRDIKKMPRRGRYFFIKDFSFENFRLRLGMHEGNRFVIRIKRKVLEKDNEILKQFREIIKEKGIPNFYGPQRFGIKRPNNHIIGKLLIKRKFEEACFEILARRYHESEGEKEIRKFIEENWGNWDRVLEELPKIRGFWVERMLLEFLRKFGDFERALLSIPKFLLRMWIDSYQSYIFNLTLSECIKMGLIVERIPLVSHYIKLDKLGEIGEIIREILRSEDIELEEFRIRKKIRPRSKYRSAYFFPRNFRYKLKKDSIILSFSLGKGEYATVLLYFLGISARK